MTAFSSEIDIINRALTKAGASRIATLTDDTPNASESTALYDKVRRAELRRNPWRFAIRKSALRPVGDFNASKFVTFGTWSNGTTYAVNDVVTGSDGRVYFSRAGSNLAHDPTSTTGYWTLYFGPKVASEYVTDWGSGFTYAAGDHAIGSDNSIYTSLSDGNINHNPVGDANVHWSLATTVDADDTTEETATTFYAGELAFIGGTTYLSLRSGNDDVPPSTKWRTLSTAPALALPNFIYPIGSGPVSQNSTRNAYRLPYGYLKEAPQDPKAGSYTALGAPTNLAYSDWEMESDYLVTIESAPIIYRYVADIDDVTQMDDSFCEGLACRMAAELCVRLTQDNTRLAALDSEYKLWMSEARLNSFIEQGPVEAPLDDWLQVRLG